MTESTNAQVRGLARLVGITIAEQDLPEVANRFLSLMTELDLLTDLDLADVQPVSVFPDEGEPDSGEVHKID